MSLRDCVGRARDSGDMDRERAERILREYDQVFDQMRQNMGHTQAEVEAARHVVNSARREAAERRRVMQLQAAASRRLVQRMEQHKNIRGEASPSDFVQDVISNRRGAGGATLVGQYEAVRRNFRRDFTDAIRKFSANLVGVRRNKETLRNVVREIFGDSTDDAAARGIAQAWGDISERARLRFNAAGGHIGKLDDWGLPQIHDMRKIRRVDYDTWKAEILPRLDLEAMGARYNDGVPFTPETIEVLMKDAHAAIRTDGYSRRSPAARQGSAMYNRRADHRFFKFKSADDWMAYNDRFGSGQDAFRVMLGHLDNMAMDISMMEEFGPNPLNQYQYLKDAAKSMELRGAAGNPDKVNSKLAQADAMFDTHTGKAMVPDNPRVAKGFSAIRQYLTSAHLGSAVISSITDFNTQRIAARFVGMGQTGFVKQMGRLMASPEFRAEANTAGLIFENAVNMGNAAARYNLEDLHIESAARLADFTIRSSGLGYLTEIQRQAFGMEFMSTMARKWKGQAFGDLEPKTRRMLESYGIRADEWGVIQKAKVHKTGNGLEILRAQEIEEAGFQKVADRYMEMITALTEFAVPSTDLYGRALILGRTKAGSPVGEFARSAMQFKAFPVTILTTQISRIMAESYQGRKLNALQYAAGLMVGNTLLGAVALQMKDVSKGKDPRDMTTAKFWSAALMQGGGAGIFGDFLFADVNRFGGGLAETLAGPTVGAADGVLRFTVGNARELALGEDTRAGRDFTNLLRRYTPGGSLWYLRLAYEREVLDQLQGVLDPDARDSFRARMRSAKDYDTEYFVKPGESILGRGARAPDISNAFGGK